MSSTIDQRAVEMTFDNSNFEKNVQTSLSTLDKLKSSLSFSGVSNGFESITDSSRKVDFSSLAGSIETIGSRFSALEVMGITALANITNSAIDAGKNIISALTIDPITTGLTEYEIKMNSIKTILSNTESNGTTLDDINLALAELNTYSDQTIYNFAQMTDMISKFTATSGELDSSVNIVKGMANLAAEAGVDNTKLQSALYQTSQAMSGSYFQAMDWNSLENAGLATLNFRNDLIETALAMGTLTQAQLDMINSGATTFSYSLSDFGWLTTDVFAAVTEMYALDDAMTAAAGEVTTFTKLFDVMKETVQSGWAVSWEYIIGDKTQSTELLTSIKDSFEALVAPTSDARNAVLEFWNVNGGRDASINAIKNAFDGLLSVLNPIKQAFTDVFPSVTGEQLVALSVGLQDLTSKFKMSETDANNLQATFNGLFSVLNLIKITIVSFGSILINLVEPLSNMGSVLLYITASIGEWLTSISSAIVSSNTFTSSIATLNTDVQKFADDFKNSLTFNTFTDALEKVWTVTTFIISNILTAISNMVSNVQTMFGNVNFDTVFNAINTIAFSGLMYGITNFIVNLTEPIKMFNGLLDGVVDILDGVKGSLEAYQNSLRADTLIKIAVAVGILAVSILTISSIDSDKIMGSLGALTVLLAELMTSLSAFSLISGNIVGMFKATAVMISISAALLILATALKSISQLSYDEMATGLVGVAGLLTMIVAMTSVINSNEAIVLKGASQLILFSAAIKILASACADLSDLNFTDLSKGLLGVGVLMASVTLFLNNTQFPAKSIAAASGVLILSASIKIMASACADFGSLDLSTIARGLLAMSASLVMITVAVNAMPAAMTGTGIAMLAIAGSLTILSKALLTLSEMSWDDIARSGVSIGSTLLILSVAINSMVGTVGGSAALLVAAASLAVLTPVLKTLGNMSWESIAKGLIAIAGAFAVIGIASVVLTPVIPSILALSGAFVLLSAGILGIGVGLAAVSAGFAALAIAVTAVATAGVAGATAFVASITVILTGIIGLIPVIIENIVSGIVTFVTAIANGASEILNAVVVICTSVLSTIRTLIPDIVETIVIMLTEILSVIAMNIPEITKSGLDIMLGFLTGIRNKIKDITIVVVEIITQFIDAVGDNISPIINSAINLMITFIDTLGETIENETPRIVQSIIGLGENIIQGLINGLFSGITSVENAVINIGESIFDGFCSFFGINSPSTVMRDDIGRYIIEGLANGLSDYKNIAVTATKNLGSSIISGIKDIFGIESPSTVMRDEVGRYIVQGIAEGITSDMSAEEAATLKAQNIVSAFKTELDKMDLDLATVNLEYQLWETTTGVDASDSEKAITELEYLSDKILIQAENVNLAKAEYQTTLDNLGEASEETQTAYNKLLQEQIDLSELSTLLNEARQTEIERNKEAATEYYAWIAENQAGLLKVGYTQSEVDLAAQDTTGYNPDSMVTDMTEVAQNAVLTAMATVQTAYEENAEDTFSTLINDFSGYGSTCAVAMGEGITNSATAVTDATTTMVYTCANQINLEQESWRIAGSYLVDGFIQGIRENIERAAEAAAEMARAAYDAAMDELSIASPSKKFATLGMYVDLGFAQGISDYAYKVTNATTDMSSEVLSGVKDTISNITDTIQNDINTQPVISPVLDLTNIANGAMNIDSLLSRTQSISIGNDANSSSNSIESGSNSSGVVNYNFTQNNTSPKALSRTEIYRQTKNQFSMLKAGGGVTV